MRQAHGRGMLRAADGGGVRTWSLFVWCVVGCGTPEPMDTGPLLDTEPKGACGDVSHHDLVLTGTVLQGDEPVEGARVVLEESVWHGGGKVFGSAISEAGGHWQLTAEQVVSVEDCWGTALAYHVVATRDEAQGRLPVNGPLYHAIKNARSEVQIQFPVKLD